MLTFWLQPLAGLKQYSARFSLFTLSVSYLLEGTFTIANEPV